MDSSTSSPPGALVDTPALWRKHETLIRQLFQGQDGCSLTLAQVRDTLIKDHQFPPLKLSIYEVRLRDTIRMRKKIQKAHWRPIWQHCRKIQQDEKSPEIYLNGSRIGWAKAWKEIRRNKFHLDDATADSKLPPLPPGVVIKPRRSSAPPSPTSLPPALANITTFYGDVLASAPRSGQRDIIRPAAAAPASLQLIRLRRDAGRISHIPHSMTSSTSPTESPVTEIQPSVSSRPENDALRSLPLEVFYNTEIVYESRFRATSSTDLSGVDLEERWKIMCFHGLPFLQLLEGIRTSLSWLESSPQNPQNAMGDNGIFSSQLFFMASLPCSYLHCQPIFFRAHDESLGSAGALSWELDPFHVLAKAIYRLSNNLVHAGPWQKPRSEDGLLYNVLFSRIPPSVFSVYLGIDIISTRVAWTELLDWSVAKKDFHHAVQLVGLALDHNPKLWEKMYASRFQVLQELSMCPSGTRDRGIELLTALGLESWELSKTSLFSWVKCLEQLPEGGGPEELGNAVRYLQRCRARTCSIMKITSGQAVVTIEFRRDTAIQVSDGDALSETELRSGEIARLATIGQVTWTYLTASHQRDQCRFHAFKASLEALQDDLVDYLKRNGRFSFLPSGLLTKIEDNPSWWTVLGRCAVDLQTERCPCPRADRWQNPLAAWEHGLAFGAVEYMRQTKGAPAAVRWLETLIGRGATICPWMLATAVSGDGWLDGLIKLQALGANMRQHGQQAMVVATRLGDRRAIDWLLEQGIDINSTVPVPETDQGHRQSIGTEDVTIVYAAAFLMAYRGKPALLEMIEYLAARGARLAQYASVSSSITFVTRLLLNQMAQRGSKANNRKRHVPSMMRLVDTVKPNSKAPSDLLTACFKSGEWDLATQLLDRNTPPSTTALASAIFNAAPTLLTQRLLDDARMDFNANNGSPHPKNIPLHVAASVFDLSLIQELVAQGADLGCATEGGLTPLVSACQGQTDSALDAERRMDVVHYLLKHGLDVNAGATRSPSALGYAARAGDLELAITLLDHGADCNGRCDLDVVDGVGYIEYPLDHAAIEGRLDMVQLLLNVGAKSGQPGQTGYDGAIERAYYAEHEEIARLIQRYAGNSMSNDE